MAENDAIDRRFFILFLDRKTRANKIPRRILRVIIIRYVQFENRTDRPNRGRQPKRRDARPPEYVWRGTPTVAFVRRVREQYLRAPKFEYTPRYYSARRVTMSKLFLDRQPALFRALMSDYNEPRPPSFSYIIQTTCLKV